MDGSSKPIVGRLRVVDEPTVRTVTTFDPDSATRQYARADVDIDGFADVVDDLRLETLTASRQEALHGLGDLHATVRVFERGTLIVVPVGDGSGVAVTVDPDCPLSPATIARRVRRAHPDAVVKS